MAEVVFAAVRPDGGPRDRSMAHVFDWWSSHGYRVEYAVHFDDGTPFHKTRLYNQAAASCEWDVGIFIDTDIVPDGPVQVSDAVAHATGQDQLCFAHDRWISLTEAGTEQVYGGRRPADCDCDEVNRNTFSSVVVVPRKLFEDARGYDEGFVGWGWEDLAFFWACASLRPRVGGASSFGRVQGDVYHLWHPRTHAHQEGNANYRANEALGHRYMEAKWSRARMSQLLARRAAETATSASGRASTGA